MILSIHCSDFRLKYKDIFEIRNPGARITRETIAHAEFFITAREMGQGDELWLLGHQDCVYWRIQMGDHVPQTEVDQMAENNVITGLKVLLTSATVRDALKNRGLKMRIGLQRLANEHDEVRTTEEMKWLDDSHIEHALSSYP